MDSDDDGGGGDADLRLVGGGGRGRGGDIKMWHVVVMVAMTLLDGVSSAPRQVTLVSYSR